MLTANGAQIDRAAARSAMDGRLSTLQNRDKAGVEYGNFMQDNLEDPEVRRINTLALTDPKAAQALLNQNPNLRKSFEIAKNIDAQGRLLVTRGYEDTEETRRIAEETRRVAAESQRAILRPYEAEVAKLEPDAKRAQINSSNASVAASNESVLTSRAMRDRAEAEADKARDLKKLGAALDGNFYKEGVYKDSDTVDLVKLMKDNNIGGGDNDSDAVDKRSKVIERINQLSKTGIEVSQKGPDGREIKTTVPLPLGTVRAALLSSTDKWNTWNEGWADTFEKNLKTKLQASYDKKTPDGKPMAANRAVDDYQNFLAIMRSTAEIAPASAPSSSPAASPKKAK